MKPGEDYTGVTVVYWCHDGEGNYLMNKRSGEARDEQGRWDCGGGAAEFGVAIEDTLRKEIKEEYCTDVLEYEFLGYRDVHRTRDGKPTHWIALEFKVRVDREAVRNGEPQKFEEIGWFRLDALPSPLHSQLAGEIEKFREKL